MSDESGFLRAIRANPDDDTARLVYADWLTERDDLQRADFVRLHAALRACAPDHVQRPAAEAELSVLRKGLATEWLAIVEPERAHLYGESPARPRCRCFFGIGGQEEHVATCEFHTEPQDTECDAWKRLCDLIEQAASAGLQVFSPGPTLTETDWEQITTLPPSIGRLKNVTRLDLTAAHLLRIPPEIGEMTSLQSFDAYMSYRLHWYPYEITRCASLRDSAVSTRAIYGNFKHRPPFPRLEPGMFNGRPEPLTLPLKCAAPTERKCSVCDRVFTDRRQHRVWISLLVGTDVLPLLVNACSDDCIGQLPAPPERYVPLAHCGGPDVRQPEPYW